MISAGLGLSVGSSSTSLRISYVAFSPPVRTWLHARYEQHFATAESAHLFRGVYGSFDESAMAAPNSKPIGYYNPELASTYRDLLDTVPLSDYPVLFRLARAIGPRTRTC